MLRSFPRLSIIAAMSAALLGACVQSGGLPGGEGRSIPEPADPDRRAAPRLELAGLYYGRGQYDIALDEIRQALAVKPDSGAAYNLRGLVYAAMGDERLAEDSFARALAINPRDADAMHNRAWFHCQLRRYDDADRGFEQALQQPQYRDQARTLMAQGVCQARAGKLLEAEQKLARAYEFDPSNSTTVLNLAEVLYRRGDFERARFYVRRVNAREETSSAQTLWLALRIENRMGNRPGMEEFGRQLRNRFPQSPEAQSYERGRFDD